MVSASKIRCVVVVADSENDRMPRNTQPRFRPSDLLPWADPHIRSLVEQLQEEVRDEAARQAEANLADMPLSEVLAGDERLARDLIDDRWSTASVNEWS